MSDNILERELFFFALSWVSGLHRDLLWPGFDDAVNRLVRSCEIRPKA